MGTMRQASFIELIKIEKALLTKTVCATRSEVRDVQCARIVLLGVQGVANRALSSELRLDMDTVSQGCWRFTSEHLQGFCAFTLNRNKHFVEKLRDIVELS